MTEQIGFILRGRNPDVLTCIANLSNDEVFTPPEMVNRVLDTLTERWSLEHGGADMWTDSSLKFLDPFTKSGVFLREITTRLIKGLAPQIPDLKQRVEHILINQVYGIGITRLTSMLARRSLYCSKFANGPHSVAPSFGTAEGNVWFERIEHSWINGKCAFCGASREALDLGPDRETHAYAIIHTPDPRLLISDIFGEAMQFDVIVGNPPYQLSDGGYGTSAAPIYQLFVEQAKKLEPRYLSMIIPARWFSGGKGLDEFRQSMLNDDRVRSIDDFLSASDVFPGVGLKGGVCYFLWDRDHPGQCQISTHFKDWPVSTMERRLLEPGVDIFIRFNEGLSILRKVMREETDSDLLTLPEKKRFDTLVSSLRPFGIRTFFRGHLKPKPGDVSVYQNGGVGYMSRDEVTLGADLIDKWKIYVGRAAPGTGNKDTYPHRIISTPFIGEPGSICSETYLCIGPFESRTEAESALSYMACRLTRLLILLHKPSQDTTRRVYTFVPKQSWDRMWTDQQLYEKYGITETEIDFIEKVVRPMALSEDLFGEVSALEDSDEDSGD